MSATTAKEFYGDAYGRAAHADKLDLAFERMLKAISTPNPSLGDKMMQLAAKSELEGFAA